MDYHFLARTWSWARKIYLNYCFPLHPIFDSGNMFVTLCTFQHLPKGEHWRMHWATNLLCLLAWLNLVVMDDWAPWLNHLLIPRMADVKHVNHLCKHELTMHWN
jgi:hypothetical protein